MEKISGVYRITNTITGDFYIGSSKDMKRRWAHHKCKYVWNKCPNNQLYKDMQKFGVNGFVFEVLEVVEESFLKEREQYFIETLKPTYNRCNAKGWDIERYKESHKKDKYKEYQKEYMKEYQKSNKGKESHKKANNKYNNQLCNYRGQTLTLGALRERFKRQGISNPTAEAKKYLIKN